MPKMVNVTVESKRLTLQIRENTERYITGEFDLKETLEKTEELYEQVLQDEEPTTANKFIHDSHLMKLQTGIARQCAKYYKPDSLVFNPTEFSVKLAQYYGQSSSTQRRSSAVAKMDEVLWMKMGDFAKKILYTVPSFNFIHGTFDPDPVEVVKKKRKMKEKDKIGVLTKPQSMSLNESSDNQDIMITEAQRVLSVFHKLCKKSDGGSRLINYRAAEFSKSWHEQPFNSFAEAADGDANYDYINNLVCYFEFVTDPTSFSRTVENIFILSLLVKEGCVRIVKDRNGLPCLALVEDSERKERNPAAVKQCIVSISMEEWQDIVQTFKFKKPLIPPRKVLTYNEANS